MNINIPMHNKTTILQPHSLPIILHQLPIINPDQIQRPQSRRLPQQMPINHRINSLINIELPRMNLSRQLTRKPQCLVLEG